jgi:hypothetical protein
MAVAGQAEQRRWAALSIRRWSRTATLVVAVVVVALELAFGAAVIGGYARTGWRAAGTPTPLVREADLDPLAQFVPTATLVHAAQAIPRDATYTVVVGQDPPVELPSDVETAFRFWLPPRRYTPNAADADWIVAFHVSSEDLGVPVAQEVGLGPAVNAVRVKSRRLDGGSRRAEVPALPAPERSP